jgi:hypothetical protein
MGRPIGSARAGSFRVTAVLAGIACAVAASACGGANSGGPSWAKGLGTQVSVTAPTSEPAGNTSPGGVVRAYVKVVNGSVVSAACPLVEPAAQSKCKHDLAGAPSTTGTKYSNFALGYVAIDGDRALVGLTGTYCDPEEKPRCSTNKNPAAILSNGSSFGTLFTSALAAATSDASTNSYSLAPCIRVNSKWYLDIPPSDV